MLLPVLYNSFFVCQTFHWPLDIHIACYCNLFSTPASFGTGDVATASVPNNYMNKGGALFGTGDVVPGCFPNNNISKGRWTQDKHKIFMQEYEKYGNNSMQIARVLSTRTPAQIKKHAECFCKQNLKTNFAAIKQYQESLSPDKKAKVLVKDSATHQNQ